MHVPIYIKVQNTKNRLWLSIRGCLPQLEPYWADIVQTVRTTLSHTIKVYCKYRNLLWAHATQSCHTVACAPYHYRLLQNTTPESVIWNLPVDRYACNTAESASASKKSLQQLQPSPKWWSLWVLWAVTCQYKHAASVQKILLGHLGAYFSRYSNPNVSNKK